MLRQTVLLVFLILVNAFFSASEIALISLNDNKVRMMAEKGDKKAVKLFRLLEEPSRFLATIQIGITLAGFLASAFASVSFADKLVELARRAGINVPDAALKTISMIVITLLLSYFTLVFGELVPKRLAMRKAEGIAFFMVGPLNFISVVAAPFVRLLTASTNLFARIFGVGPKDTDQNVTEEEIRLMVDVGEEIGTIEEAEKRMINNIFEFNNKTVEDIMTHRTNIAAASTQASLKEITELIQKEQYTRIPVYEGDIDNIVGVLHSKDLIPYVTEDCEEIDFSLQDVIRKPYFVPASKKTDELFLELQKNKTHMAIVIDDYGGTAGIVTMEDLIEEIMGSILDEYDEEEKDIEVIDENTWLVNGMLGLDVVSGYFDVDLPIDEYDTLSGFIIGQLGRFPDNGEEASVEFNGMAFKVKEAGERRIARVLVCRS